MPPRPEFALLLAMSHERRAAFAAHSVTEPAWQSHWES